MKVKVFADTEPRFQRALDNVLATAGYVMMGQFSPKIRQEELFVRDPHAERYYIVPARNDSWANIREEGENFTILEFNLRYDREGQKKKTLTDLILAWFPDNTEAVE